MFIIKLSIQHVSGIIMPIITRIRLCPTACGVLPECVESNRNFYTVHTAHDAAPQDHSQPQPTHPGRTLHAVRHGPILLMMGIMMPETCWDRKFDNKRRISCILLVPSLHLIFTMHGHKNLKKDYLRTQLNKTMYFLPYRLQVSAFTAIIRPILYKYLKTFG